MRNGKSTQTFFTLVLLLLFGVSMLFCVLYELEGYERMNSLSASSQIEHLPFAYLSQKMRSALKINAEDNTLVIDNGGAVTRIYFYDGYLYELTTLAGYDFDPSFGEKLFVVEGMEIKKEHDRIFINYAVNGQKERVVFSFRGSQDE